MARKASGKSAASSAHLGFEAKLWLTADKLRNNMDAAEYKHIVLGLIFHKYSSDTGAKCRMPNCECRTIRKPQCGPLAYSSFGIRPSNFPAPTIGKIVDWRMSNAEVRMPN